MQFLVHHAKKYRFLIFALLFLIIFIGTLCFLQYSSEDTSLNGLPDKINQKSVLTDRIQNMTQFCFQILLSFDNIQKYLEKIQNKNYPLINDLKKMIKKNGNTNIEEALIEKYVKDHLSGEIKFFDGNSMLGNFVSVFFTLLYDLDMEISMIENIMVSKNESLKPLLKFFCCGFKVSIDHKSKVNQTIEDYTSKSSGSYFYPDERETGNKGVIQLGEDGIKILHERLTTIDEIKRSIIGQDIQWSIVEFPLYLFSYIEGKPSVFLKILEKLGSINSEILIGSFNYKIFNVVVLNESKRNISFFAIRGKKIFNVGNNFKQEITATNFTSLFKTGDGMNIVVILRKFKKVRFNH